MRQLLNNTIIFALIFNQTLVFASTGIVPDGQTNTTMDQSQNQIPVVNIAPPSNAGVSYNTYTDFNVDANGAIINNSSAIGNSNLGGTLLANPNFGTGNAAEIIVNEVTSTNQSFLQGVTEVFGKKAEVILANPNGITCQACGFVNTSRIGLIAGSSVIQNGNLLGFNLSNAGFVKLTSNGQNQLVALNATNVDYVDIIANTIQIAGSVYAKNDLNIKSGNVAYNYNTKEIISNNEDFSGQISIDAKNFGALQAGKIEIVASQNGVGVNLKNGEITASSGNLILMADGTLTNSAKLQSMNNIGISAENLANTGEILANGDATIFANNIQNNGKIIADDIQIYSQNLVNSGQIAALSNLLISSASVVNNEDSLIYSGNNMEISADTILNDRAEIYSGNNMILQGQSFVTNRMGRVQSQGNIGIYTQNFLNKGNVEYSQNPVWEKIYEEASINDEGSEWDVASIYIDTSSKINKEESPALLASGGNMVIIATNFTNDASTISAGQNLEIISENAKNVSYQEKYLFEYIFHGEEPGQENVRSSFEFTADSNWLKNNTHTYTISAIQTNGYAYIMGPRDEPHTVNYQSNFREDFSHIGNSKASINAGGSVNIQTNSFDNSIVGNEIMPVGGNNANSQNSSQINLPSGNNGIFTISSTPNSQYLIETNLPAHFLDQNQFIGSQYFLSRIGYDVDSDVVLIGDPFYQTRFITDQIQQKLNQKYTENGISSDSEQIKL